MPNYTIYNGQLVNADEIKHYGVPGMKWGVHKVPDNYISRANTKRKAKLAAKTAYTNALSSGSSKKDAKKAMRDAAEKSIAADKAYNQKTRAKKETARIKESISADNFRSARKEVGKSRSTGLKLVTNLLAGPFANRTYNSVIAAGGKESGAIAMTAATALLGGPIGHLAVSAIYTHKAGRRELEKNY